MRKHRSVVTATSRRRGSALVFAMIALLVTSLIGASLLRNSFLSLQQVKREQSHMQANWLAEAGCRRAIHRLGNEPAYTGETWQISAEQMKAPFSATVTIAISEGEASSERTITTIADYPAQATSQFRVRKKLTIGRPAKTE